MGRVRHLFGRLAGVARAVLGVPDYDRYLAHMRAHHPRETPLSRSEFIGERLSARYEKPGAKCC